MKSDTGRLGTTRARTLAICIHTVRDPSLVKLFTARATSSSLCLHHHPSSLIHPSSFFIILSILNPQFHSSILPSPNKPASRREHLHPTIIYPASSWIKPTTNSHTRPTTRACMVQGLKMRKSISCFLLFVLSLFSPFPSPSCSSHPSATAHAHAYTYAINSQ